MTHKNDTDIVIVLDRSGSMRDIAGQTIEGFNTFLEEQRKDVDHSKVTLILFDDQYEVVHLATPLAQTQNLTDKTFVPRGMTALLDAMGQAINETGQRLAAMPEDQRPGHVLFVTITDGHENASTQFTHRQLADMIAHQRDVYQWQFVFLGANQDAIATAVDLRMDPNAALTYMSTGKSSKAAWSKMSQSMSSSRKAWKLGKLMDMSFSEHDQADVLADDPADKKVGKQTGKQKDKSSK